MNGDLWERWRVRWRRLMPGASEEEVERRVREALGRPAEAFRAERNRMREWRSPAQPMFGEGLEDTFIQWRRWLDQAAAWMKQFEKEPPWKKITGGKGWQELTRNRW